MTRSKSNFEKGLQQLRLRTRTGWSGGGEESFIMLEEF